MHSITRQLRGAARAGAESVRTAVSFLHAYLSARLAPAFADAHGEIASWVVVTAIVVAASVTIGGIIVAFLTKTASSITGP